ncbi:MAG: hypothetical protein J6W54_00220 [Fibrobacter sp.]|uniref:hypothetical protein n=1 Tax=Fibrobacter sp. TaxID=35828 RepID=UPI001AFECCBF|nr:hypothetical protein [Fibrobacter sp.]MBO7059515.1 hypothetical protein [Fibrobacter sp.]
MIDEYCCGRAANGKQQVNQAPAGVKPLFLILAAVIVGHVLSLYFILCVVWIK